MKLSGLPHHKSLDDFDFSFQPKLDARKIKDLAALGFVEERANVCLLGPPGAVDHPEAPGTTYDQDEEGP